MGRQSCQIVQNKNRRRPIWDAKVAKSFKQKPPEANMGRQKLPNCMKKTAGGKYGMQKVEKLFEKKNRRRPIWDAKG